MQTVINILKSSRVLYSLYYCLGSLLLKMAGCFIRTDNRLILINSFGGKKYDDSPKAIFLEMLKEKRFSKYKIVWAIGNGNHYDEIKYSVKPDTIDYFVTALKAKVWITNSSMERGLKFKKKETIYINTNHGTPIKKMGTDIVSNSNAFGTAKKLSGADIMFAQSEFEVDVFSSAFNRSKEAFYITGLPRNDDLVNVSKEKIERIKEKLGINNEKILLYAPTFRDYSRKNKTGGISLSLPIKLEKWQKLLEGKYKVLFRAHYEVAEYLNIKNYSVFIDVTKYPTLSDLMIISDALISDYSSIMIDYSILHKPIYCFAYDLEEYSRKRGMYIDIRKELPCKINYSEDELLKEILREDYEKYQKRLISFQRKYATVYGDSAKRCCDIIYNKICTDN